MPPDFITYSKNRWDKIHHKNEDEVEEKITDIGAFRIQRDINISFTLYPSCDDISFKLFPSI